jgi:hypothetical protein
MPQNNLIQFRKGTYSSWDSTNPVLANGEPGFDTTNNVLKIGDGSTNWNDLPGIDFDLAMDTGLLAGNGIIFSEDTINNTLTINTGTIAKFTSLDNNPPASDFATLDTRNSIAVLDFSDTTEESAVFTGVLPEGAVVSSGLEVRVLWTATSATTGNCRWGAQFERMNTDLDADSFDTATEAHSTTNATNGIPTITTLTCTNIDSLVAGDFFRLKIYRDALDTTNDTLAADAELIAVEVRGVI